MVAMGESTILIRQAKGYLHQSVGLPTTEHLPSTSILHHSHQLGSSYPTRVLATTSVVQMLVRRSNWQSSHTNLQI